jgi:hypothetical protein
MGAGDFVELDPLKNAQNSITHAPPTGVDTANIVAPIVAPKISPHTPFNSLRIRNLAKKSDNQSPCSLCGSRVSKTA